ncbi:MAG: 4Fe-4S binding protein [Planctomycetota bacterium]
MCEFCMKHGNGKKWYLEAKNYSTDLVKNSQRFKDLLNWLLSGAEAGGDAIEKFRKYLRLPVVGRALSWMTTRKMKRDHFGQVIPLEDVKNVFELVDVIYGFPCVCRRYLLGNDDERYCFGVGNFGKEFLDDIPSFGGGAQELTLQEACELAEGFEKKGLVHTIWTLDTPFIIGICSCKPGECMAMEMTLGMRTKVMFKGEYLFRIDPEKCVGCRKCMKTCYFGAMDYLESEKRCQVNPYKCHGCGLCRRVCPAGAAHMVERPAAMKALSKF